MNTNQQIGASIEAAKIDLEEALQHLRQLPALDWGAVRYALHTLGNYLNITGACVYLLGDAVKDHSTPEIDSYLNCLDRTTALMTHLIRHLSHASVSREATLLREKVNLTRQASLASTYYQVAAEHKRIVVLCQVEDPVAYASGDRIAVATVLDNLLSNAVKYSPADKRIWVRVKADPNQVVCAVQDEGPGLSPEDQARLFREGERLTPMPTGGESSTGYGLAISRDLVAQMGGRIWCESQLGQGATFSFCLPAYSEAAPQEHIGGLD